MNTWIGALGVTLGLALPLSAQEGAAPPWSVNCSNLVNGSELICEMTQSIVLTENNQRLTSIAFIKAAGNDEIETVLTLPFGLLFSEGLVAKVDDTEVARLEFLTCEAQGCFARSPVSPEWISAMRAGKQLQIDATNRIGEPISFGFDLTGFSKVSGLLP
ncbi:Invasion protein B, involved in pathogenesis [Ruegeria denitrificans]|uniref:Invasion protein B, involved in pathogenesis n=1 Tax=Ruegeria denitrificans TaxID=1715692 RepID=A0A0N7MAX2_9RHOB|nr:invasion-associated locus B family protein [Ruegeria denitrificans]CUK17791.1 Invasion protein B, involved in pathogenesis [Ruegeria denitrificans]